MKANNVREILHRDGFVENDFIFYGNEIAKIKDISKKENKRGKLILVTSTSPTKYGEGKTTLAISLNDALRKLNKRSVVVLREPSLGPVFGMKGGATGGGCASIEPEMEINLHFTGDIHAITSANNLLAAILDNHIFQGNELQIDPTKICHERCIDLNDRSLRNVVINGVVTHFNISTASEFMALLCMSKDEEDLRMRIGNIVVAYTYENKPVYAKDLKCINALFLLLKDAIKPNIVSTKEQNLAIVHGGPFANIAHGTNSIISTNYAVEHYDYTIVEAGFGSDMGALKFYDIITRVDKEFIPDVVVLNTTVQSLKHNGEESLEKGIKNLYYHIENMRKYTNNLIVVLNKHETDSKEEISFIEKYVKELGILFSISTGYLEGSCGSLEAAQKVTELAKCKPKEIIYSYDVKEDLKTKIEKFCKVHYRAKEIVYSKEILEKLERYRNIPLPICVAKTQYSITDDAQVLGYPKDFIMTVKNIKLFQGAGFITVYFGEILTMPGLGKKANYLYM